MKYLVVPTPIKVNKMLPRLFLDVRLSYSVCLHFCHYFYYLCLSYSSFWLMIHFYSFCAFC